MEPLAVGGSEIEGGKASVPDGTDTNPPAQQVKQNEANEDNEDAVEHEATNEDNEVTVEHEVAWSASQSPAKLPEAQWQQVEIMQCEVLSRCKSIVARN